MEQILRTARRLTGEVVVPGEAEVASQALVLAALAEGDSLVANAPPAVGPLVELLRRLGAGIEAQPEGLQVRGCGLRGFQEPSALIELKAVPGASLLLIALLAGQRFASRVRLGPGHDDDRRLLGLLPALGAEVLEEMSGCFRLGGREVLAGAELGAGDLTPPVKLALLVAGLFADGITRLREPARGRDGYERLLRQRQVEVRRRLDGEEGSTAELQGGQPLAACSVQIPGDLKLALPVVVAALGLKGSDVQVKGVAVRPGGRAFIDLVRQLGGPVDVEEDEEGGTHLRVRHGHLKATRVAGARAQRLAAHVALLAVLATQTEGEFVLRDLEALRQGAFDYLSHLAEQLRRIQAKVGEFPEGLIVEGGWPLQGARIETRQDPGLAQAFAVAGLMAEGETAIDGAECMEPVFPGFFAALEALKAPARGR